MIRDGYRFAGELFGGPADGAKIYLAVVQQRYYVPIVWAAAMNRCGRTWFEVGPVAVYELGRDPAGHPVISPGGRLAYRYSGTR